MKLRNINNKGNAAIEFAIILPLFLFICLGIIEFSVLLYDKAMITNASREGARKGILFVDIDLVDPVVDIESVVSNTVNKYLQNWLISFGSSSTATVETNPDYDIPGSSDKGVKVTVRYNYNFLVLPNLSSFFGSGFTDTQTLEAITVMRKEDQSES
ncbi:MAG: pilus assembly protein [Deltaproteobacteria bacterium]|nr:pilus assembly protein [Deltaproteobacteria bacterium]MBL7204715.1 pilus assembly protein [Desulfobacteraceae bacterium]